MFVADGPETARRAKPIKRLENREVKNMNSIYYLMVVISVLLEGLDPARSMYKIENG